MGLGFSSNQAKSLCKTLSRVVAGCSYAIYLAHNNLAWSHSTDLVIEEQVDKPAQRKSEVQRKSVDSRGADVQLPRNIKMLRNNGVQSLFHFTDATNLASIREHGLLPWKKIEKDHIECKMNSSTLSHELDTRKGLEEYIRLSFCRNHPMMFQALKDKRITRPVILEINLQVVSRPGVLFCERNAAASGAETSANPNVIRFEVVKKHYGAVSNEDKPFYQGEVLVPVSVPPHLIRFPKVDSLSIDVWKKQRFRLSTKV